MTPNRRALIAACSVCITVAVAALVTRVHMVAPGTHHGSSLAPSLEYLGLKVQVNDPAERRQLAKLIESAKEGDQQSRVDFLWSLDDSHPDGRSRDIITSQLTRLATSPGSDIRTSREVLLMLSYRSGSRIVGDLLCNYAVDRHRDASLRRAALEALGRLAGPDALRAAHPERYPTEAGWRRAINEFLNSHDTEDNLAAIRCVESGQIEQMYPELRKLRRRTSDHRIREYIDEVVVRLVDDGQRTVS